MEGKKAQALLHKLMEEDDPRRIFGMIVRQFRLVLLAREILDNGGRQAGVMEQLHLRDFIAEKIIAQARKYTLDQLESSYRRLLVWDESIKSGYFEDGSDAGSRCPGVYELEAGTDPLIPIQKWWGRTDFVVRTSLSALSGLFPTLDASMLGWTKQTLGFEPYFSR